MDRNVARELGRALADEAMEKEARRIRITITRRYHGRPRRGGGMKPLPPAARAKMLAERKAKATAAPSAPAETAKTAAYEVGRLIAGEALIKSAEDKSIRVFVKAAVSLGRKAGLSDRDIVDMVKGAGWGGAATGAGIGTMIMPGIGTAVGGLLGYGAQSLADWWRGGNKQQGQQGGGMGSGVQQTSPAVKQMFQRGGWNPNAYNQKMNYLQDMMIGQKARQAQGRQWNQYFNTGLGF